MKKEIKKEVTIVTEGEFDAQILKRLLGEKMPNVTINILAAMGYSSALSKVKSLLTIRNKNIVLILDADTVDKNEIRQKEDFVNSYVNTNLNKENFKAFWAVPEFEIIFLNNIKFMSELSKKKISKELIEVAKISPKRTLESMSKKGRKEYLQLLDQEEIREDFFREGLIKDLFEYLNK